MKVWGFVVLVGFVAGIGHADNCYMYDRTTQEGEQSYEACKDQTRDMDRAQDRLDRYIDQSNKRNDADQQNANSDQTNILLRALQQQQK